jgi:uncharacterized phage protein gp47/JayE
MDDLVANLNLTRLAATKASGTVTFYKLTVPTTTIRIGTEDGSGGIIISTQRNSDGSYYSFITTATVYLTPSTQLNTETGRYEVNAAIEAVEAGEDSNVAINAITVLTGVAGVDGVTNKNALTSGTDEESNTELAARYVTASQGRLLGTAPGYATFVEAITGIIDAIVITSGEENSIRNANGNEVDVVIVGEDYESVSQVETFSNVDGLTAYFDNTPINEVIQIIGNTFTFIENTDFLVVKDTFSEQQGSNQALDKIIWLGANDPSVGENYTVTYTYNKLVDDVQDELDDADNKLIASDVLVREGERVEVDIEFDVQLYSGIDSASAILQIKSTLQTYINTLYLGGKIEQSDLVFYLRTAHSFIDNLTLPFTKLCLHGSSGVADLEATKLQYFYISADNITVNVT